MGNSRLPASRTASLGILKSSTGHLRFFIPYLHDRRPPSRKALPARPCLSAPRPGPPGHVSGRDARRDHWCGLFALTAGAHPRTARGAHSHSQRLPRRLALVAHLPRGGAGALQHSVAAGGGVLRRFHEGVGQQLPRLLHLQSDHRSDLRYSLQDAAQSRTALRGTGGGWCHRQLRAPGAGGSVHRPRLGGSGVETLASPSSAAALAAVRCRWPRSSTASPARI